MDDRDNQKKLIEDYINKHGVTRDLKKVSKKEHQKFLNSSYWKNFRVKYVKAIGSRCELCFSIANLCVHHNNYWNKGKETSEDVIILCGECHDKFHKNIEHFIDYNKLIRINDIVCVEQKQDPLLEGKELESFLTNNSYNDRCCLCSNTDKNPRGLFSLGDVTKATDTQGIVRKLSMCGTCKNKFKDVLAREVVNDYKINKWKLPKEVKQKIASKESLIKEKKPQTTFVDNPTPGISLSKCISCKEWRHYKEFLNYKGRKSEYCSNCLTQFQEYKKEQDSKHKKWKKEKRGR